MDSIQSIEQPPFFRTAEINRVLFPSKCYKIPSKPCIIEESLDSLNRTNRHFSMVKKDKSKSITFVGVDAVVYSDSQPTTKLQPLSAEECDAIFNKTEREAVMIVEDEETLRNDSLLEYFDELDDDSDIPVSQLRQYLHSSTLSSSLGDVFEDSSDSYSFNEDSFAPSELTKEKLESRPSEYIHEPSLSPDTTDTRTKKKKSGHTKVYTPKAFSFDMIPDSPMKPAFSPKYPNISPQSPNDHDFSDNSPLYILSDDTTPSSQDSTRREQSFPPFGTTPFN